MCSIVGPAQNSDGNCAVAVGNDVWLDMLCHHVISSPMGEHLPASLKSPAAWSSVTTVEQPNFSDVLVTVH